MSDLITMQAAETSNVIVEEVPVGGASRILEGRFGYPADGKPTWSCLILGPHPLLGGDLENNLVNALVTGLAEAGGATLAFNYSGVGSSEGGPEDWPGVMSEFWEKGCFAEERDWIIDAASARRTLSRLCDRPMLVVGYSFGCWAASEILAQSTASAAVFISPNSKHHDFTAMDEFSRPLLVVHSDNDFTATTHDFAQWFDTLRDPKRACMLLACEHFFRGQEEKVVQTVLGFLAEEGVGVLPVQ